MPKRKAVLAVIAALGLASCGQPKFEPHVAGAMQVMRDGDYKRYDTSKAAAQHEVDSGWQLGGDPCQLQDRDFENAGALDVVNLLDNETVFKFSEDMRFVYTANIAGRNGFDNRKYPYTRAMETAWQRQKDCQRDGPLIATNTVELTREIMIKAWWDDLEKRYGKEQFERRMTAAANMLTFRGIDAAWPPRMDMDYVTERAHKS
jgi:hypothetical protein